MLGGISGFVRRHKRKIILVTGLAASGYFLVDYVKTKFFELQDRLATERAAKENLKRRFEQNQQDASFTIMALLPTLTDQIVEKYPVESITAELQAKRTERSIRSIDGSETSSQVGLAESVQTLPSETSVSSSVVADIPSATEAPKKKTKTQLWKELKIQSLSRAFTILYSSALLVFFTRLQLNILGRKNYVVSVLRLAEKRADAEITLEDYSEESLFGGDVSKIALEEEEMRINRMFLTFSWWLLNKGWVSLSERIQDAVIAVFDQINPRTDMTLTEFSELIGKVQFSVDHNGALEKLGSNFLNNLLPPHELESYVLAQAPTGEVEQSEQPAINDTLRKLLDETADFVESPNATDVIHKLVHNGLSVFVDGLSGLFPEQADDDEVPRAKLASILANVTRQANAMTGGTPFEPNDYIKAMIDLPELDGFSALVYSNFDWSNLGHE
ncbi:peroxisomal biogenesis factor 3 [Trichomonascus vanleenenianus]|uniref:Pex3p n=1 Tax=Trichomonascus vanleenenianus TaxID=2268995 RepID=UPI003ECA0443